MCESSATVREAFRLRGHDAWSCDLVPSERDGQHIIGDALKVIEWGCWDLIIAHPPCTHLSSSGARWFKEKRADGRQQQAIHFFMQFAAMGCDYAIENPIGVMSTRWRKPDQIIQPWQFGHGECKATCLWLNGLPPLTPTNIVPGREQRIWKMAPGPDRERERSRTFQGIAEAMADQWS